MNELVFRQPVGKDGDFIYYDLPKNETRIGRSAIMKGSQLSQHLPIEQSTGLLDCKGQRIFAGDTVRILNISGELKMVATIVFINGGFFLEYTDDDDDAVLAGFSSPMKFNDELLFSFEGTDIEVIGNIHGGVK